MEPVTVYIDMLFLVNFIIDYFLLSATGVIRRLNYSKLRLLPAAALGGLYSCLVFFPVLTFVFTVPGKIIISALMVLIGFRRRGLKSYLITFLCFHISSIAFGGLMMGVEMLFSPRNMLVSNGEFYINISALTLVLIASAAYVTMLIFTRVIKPRGREELLRLTVTVDDKTSEMTALHDSGNMLTDTLTGAHVIIVSRQALKSVIPPEAEAAFIENGDITLASGTPWQTRVCTIPYSTVSGSGILPAFRPDTVTVDGAELEQKTVIAVKNGRLNEKYEAIVGSVI